MQRKATIFAMLWLALPGSAQPVQDQISNRFNAWAETHDVAGAIGIAQRDGSGVWTIAAPDTATKRELASLSKSITAACALTLVNAGKLGWSDRLPKLLGEAPDVTVAQVVTHSAGQGADVTQVAMPRWLDRSAPDTTHYSQQVLDAINARPSRTGTAGSYHYNNENYALLGLVIEAASGKSFHDYCWPALGLNTDIAPSPRTGRMQTWGGIAATPAAYLNFLTDWYGPDGAIGGDPFALPHIKIADGVYYGMGMLFRVRDAGFNFWHFGALCFPGRLDRGSYAVIWEGEAAALATYDACLDWRAMQALDAALASGFYGAWQ